MLPNSTGPNFSFSNLPPLPPGSVPSSKAKVQSPIPSKINPVTSESTHVEPLIRGGNGLKIMTSYDDDSEMSQGASASSTVFKKKFPIKINIEEEDIDEGDDELISFISSSETPSSSSFRQDSAIDFLSTDTPSSRQSKRKLSSSLNNQTPTEESERYKAMRLAIENDPLQRLNAFKKDFFTPQKMAESEIEWLRKSADLIAERVIRNEYSMSPHPSHQIASDQAAASSSSQSVEEEQLEKTFTFQFNPEPKWTSRMKPLFKQETPRLSSAGSQSGAVILIDPDNKQVQSVVKTPFYSHQGTGKKGIDRPGSLLRERFSSIFSEKMKKAGLGEATDIGVPESQLGYVPCHFFSYEGSKDRKAIEAGILKDYLCSIHQGIPKTQSFKFLLQKEVKELTEGKRNATPADYALGAEKLLKNLQITDTSQRMLAILDTILYQTDRSANNLLVQLSEAKFSDSLDSPKQGTLVPIDGSLILPEGFEDPAFICWLNWPGVNTPFSRVEKDFISQLSLDQLKDDCALVNLPFIENKTEKTLYISLQLVKKGVGAGLTIGQIASLSFVLSSDLLSIVLAKSCFDLASQFKDENFNHAVDEVIDFYMESYKAFFPKDSVLSESAFLKFKSFCKKSVEEFVIGMDPNISKENQEPIGSEQQQQLYVRLNKLAQEIN